MCYKVKGHDMFQLSPTCVSGCFSKIWRENMDSGNLGIFEETGLY